MYKDLLERVRSLYIQATLIEDLQLQFQYCIDNNLQFGLCNAISILYMLQSNITQFSYYHIDNLIDTCCKELTDKMFNLHYYWPTPKDDHLLQSRYSKVSDVNELCLLPRIQCLDLMIKNLSDGAK